MSCYHPLFAIKFYASLRPDLHKDARYNDYGQESYQIVVFGRDELLTLFDRRDAYYNAEDFDFSDFSFLIKMKYGKDVFPIQLPCRKCVGCRLDYAARWAERCMLEVKSQPPCTENYFLTLTYDDAHLPFCRLVDPDGCAVDVPNLVPDHMSYFLKRLRKRFPSSTVRFFGCGEYGGKEHRPHYHMILFNCPIKRTLIFQKSSRGYMYFTSPVIGDCWSVPIKGRPPKGYVPESLGFHWLTNVTYDTASYVARYTLKKAVDPHDDLFDLGLEPEFIRMSRDPGIAAEYFAQHGDEIYGDHLGTLSEGFKHPVRSPAYFDKLFDRQHPCTLEYIKDARKAFDTFPIKSYDQLARDERAKLDVTKSLPRSLSLAQTL